MDALEQLNRDHTSREVRRLKVQAPIALVGAVAATAAVAGGALLWSSGHSYAGAAVALAGLVVAVLWWKGAQLLAEWDRAVILRFGRYHATRGPGFFLLLPVIDNVARILDLRVRTTSFYSESTLTSDTVPVRIAAIAFWRVLEPEKAVLEVENYYQAIVIAVQTALRDIVGVHSLADLLAERESVAETLQKLLQQKTRTWGIEVSSIEIRDIDIPEGLKDALSKQAQADRERQARTILGQAEIDLSEKFKDASDVYADNPVALQLRAMNIVYEGLRAGGSLMVIPTGVIDALSGAMSGVGPAPAEGPTEPDPKS